MSIIEKRVEKIKEDFALETLYQEHKDIALELIQKAHKARQSNMLSKFVGVEL